MTITVQQIRAARAFLNWSSRDLALKADVTPNTVSRSQTSGDVKVKTLRKLQAALEAGGVTFLPGNGVRLDSQL